MLDKSIFLLDRDIYFLNNGSYGATPREVFDIYQSWQRELEFQPIQFFQKKLTPAINRSKDQLSRFISCDGSDLILIKNATYATNLVVRSLDLREGDEVLMTDHEYGACVNSWQFWSEKVGFTIKKIHTPLPIDSSDVVESFRSAISSETKVIYFSHITSATAQLLPVKELIQLCKERDLISVVDGAHAVGQVDLSIKRLDPDFYYSNIHKWLFAPKGTAFLYTKKEKQTLIKPLIVGWGWGDERNLFTGSDYIDSNQFYGTDDLSSFLVIPESIKFFHYFNIAQKRLECREIVSKYLSLFSQLLGKNPLYSGSKHPIQMGIFEIPKIYEVGELKSLLIDRYKIEIPVTEWDGRVFIRISFQVYNRESELDYLYQTIKKLFVIE
jgi:isopenicillin-N epimerase